MKTQNEFFRLLLLVVFSLVLTNCSTEETVEPRPEPEQEQEEGEGELTTSAGTSADRFDTYAGEMGIVLDTRELAKIGYIPVTAEIDIDAQTGDYSQTIEIEPITFMGQLKLIKEELTQEAIDELESGVLVSWTIKDMDNVTITSGSRTTSFGSNPSPIMAMADGLAETDESRRVNLSEDTSYYFQPIDGDDNPEPGQSMSVRASNQSFIMTSASGTEFNGSEDDRNFSFVPIPGKANTFAIRIKSGGRFLYSGTIINTATVNLVTGAYSHLGLAASDVTDFNLIQSNLDFQFKIEKIDTSIYELQNSSGTAVRMAPNVGLTFDMVLRPLVFGVGNNISSQPIRWRLISTTIDWRVENVGTSFLQPILGEAETDFKFNSTLTNCGRGGLSQKVGVETTEIETGTVGWEESLSINTTNSISISTSVNVEFDAKFFGKGAKYNASITAAYDYGRSVEETSTKFGEKSEEVGTKAFSERTVTVPSGSASLVYDAFQFYQNTKVNFVQRLRVSGMDSQTGRDLTGDEVRSQFQFSGFDGVISAVEPNSIVITLRGTTSFDQIVEIESKVEDVAANCGG
ncbi:hypothetical protein [Poritiphilus flavus]|uniref:Uncharacterized protein n=1 Tax=Poritiphilus flavus TaxID=2697053 RepID=A0A6L9E7J6_9FLAO|nr:hypothetical protein [Poritiphilus flavus]NAS10523.1 hypothetical protein [Poritiphilus flavus]